MSIGLQALIRADGRSLKPDTLRDPTERWSSPLRMAPPTGWLPASTRKPGFSTSARGARSAFITSPRRESRKVGQFATNFSPSHYRKAWGVPSVNSASHRTIDLRCLLWYGWKSIMGMRFQTGWRTKDEGASLLPACHLGGDPQ